MIVVRELLFWKSDKSWYEESHDKYLWKLTDKAPERAKISYEKWKKLQDNPRR